jgi:hypothetical protein
MGHPVGGLTGGEETTVLSIYTFISTKMEQTTIRYGMRKDDVNYLVAMDFHM